jgi:hypothetical protein
VPNTINPRPLEAALNDLKRAGMSDSTLRLFRDTFTRSEKTLTNLGQIQSQVPITGRTEPIGTTVTNITSAGQLASTDNIAADGTGSPLTGGRRGFQALDTNNRLANSFRNTAVNVAGTPTSSANLSNDGISTSITVAANTNQFGAGTVSYNSGSVDPGVFGGPNYVVVTDPTFAGGAEPYTFNTTPQSVTSAEGNVSQGSITTVNGAGKTGGGNTGGTGGKGGGKGYPI